MISVIIPTLNEEKNLAGLIEDLRASNMVEEIIVVDGGSSDNTVDLAERLGTIVIPSKKGRALQMNEGAKHARGEIILFLHADSRIEPDYLKEIPAALNRAKAGSYYLAFDKKGFLLNFYSKMSRLNISLFTYGDQGLFLKKRFFEELRGFKEIPIMEDLDIVRRSKRKGQFVKLDLPVVSSARRFMKNGIVRQQLMNIMLVMLFFIGIKPQILARFYSY